MAELVAPPGGERRRRRLTQREDPHVTAIGQTQHHVNTRRALRCTQEMEREARQRHAVCCLQNQLQESCAPIHTGHVTPVFVL